MNDITKGLMQPLQRQQSTPLNSLRTELGPQAVQTLDDQLEAFSESELSQVQQMLRLLKQASQTSLQFLGRAEPYDVLTEITIKDGRKFIGLLQFGTARLADYKAASGKRFTQDEFQADEALQDEVAQWHFNDIDKAIDALGDAGKGYDRDGLRSVAHLGGTGGMQRFVTSGGKYNPSDELGTSLRSYYNKFSSNGGNL